MLTESMEKSTSAVTLRSAKMPTIDLSQLPQPTIIEELDFEEILIEVKAVMVAAYPADQQAAVIAALALESEPLNISPRRWHIARCCCASVSTKGRPPAC
jgi:hypothetical protein